MMIEWVVTGTLLTLTVILLRAILKSRIGLRLRYGLWALVLVRLLIPFSIDSRLSVMNLIPKPEISNPTASYIDGQYPNLTATEITSALSDTQQQLQLQQNQPVSHQEITAEKNYTETTVNLKAVLLGIWITGMFLTGSVFLGANLHFAVRLSKSRNAVSVQNSPLPVFVSNCVSTPCLYGLFFPKVYLTPDFNTQRLDHVLIHEKTHWRHGDHIWSFLRCVCLVLHWYNPLVWIAAILSKQDAELACDEAVLKELGDEQRTNYGKTLIEMSCVKQDPSGLLITATTMITTKRSLKERITMIAKKPKTAILTLIVVLLVAAAAVGCTFTGAENPLESTSPVMKACHFEEANAIYVYEKPGFGSDFFIKINRDGTFTYREGSLSSYFGLGTWTLTDDILALTDTPAASPDLAFYNEFRVEDDALIWLAENSTGFMYRGHIPLADGGRFLYRGSEEDPTPMVTYVGSDGHMIEDYFDGGQRATFVNVDGVVFVWDHFAVDTLDGLAVAQVGTVTENDKMKIPETHLAACRVPVGTKVYMGKDVQDSPYPAVYCKWDNSPYYARFLPESAFHGDSRWWESLIVTNGSKALTFEKLIPLAKEKGALLSHTDLGHRHIELINSNGMIYKLYDVEEDYRLMLVCANTQTAIEVLSTKLYRKDSPDNYIDIRTADVDAFINQGKQLLSDNVIIVDNKTGDVVYASNVPTAMLDAVQSLPNNGDPVDATYLYPLK